MRVLSLIFILMANFCLASVQTSDQQELKKPDLGTCDEYTDYYIYKCQPFSCKLPVAGMPQVTREMEVIGYENGYCIHKFKIIVRNPHFPFTDLKTLCKLSESGRLEVANQFTEYKKGKIEVYANPSASDLLSKECSVY